MFNNYIIIISPLYSPVKLWGSGNKSHFLFTTTGQTRSRITSPNALFILMPDHRPIKKGLTALKSCQAFLTSIYNLCPSKNAGELLWPG
jgi:hypothetical protein